MIPITQWLRRDESDRRYTFNHTALGHDHGATPTPISAHQRKAWAGAKWAKRLTVMMEGVVQ